MSSNIPISTATILARRMQQRDKDVENATSSNRSVNPQIWIHTTPRRASIARMSMQMKSLPAYLIYQTESGAYQRFDLTKSVYTIGRKDDRDIVLQCPQISKHHASIQRTELGYLITDHNSANGVFINDQPVDVCQHLKNQDKIQLGTVVLEFFDEVQITPYNARGLMQNHPAFAAHFGKQVPIDDADSDGQHHFHDHDENRSQKPSQLDTSHPLMHSNSSSHTVIYPHTTGTVVDYSRIAGKLSPRSPSSPHKRPYVNSIVESFRRANTISIVSDMSNTSSNESSSFNVQDKHLSLVTILPSEQKYEETITVRAELSSDSNDDFLPASEVSDMETLRNDYEKLRMAYALSKLGLTEINILLERMLDLMFQVLPVDRGVVMLVDRKTGILTTEKVKLRTEKNTELEHREILLSGTILKKVFATKRCFITTDAFEDPELGKAQSITKNQIRSVICVPLVAHSQVLGILHLDSQDRINAFAEKDLQLVKTISNQSAIAIENCKLLQDIEKEVTIRENLGRFLAPHVVDRCIDKGEEPIRKGGRQTHGTILFADIRGFTQMSEESSPQEVVDLLNDFFERLVRIVFKYDGLLDKYIGDCLMAAFGTLPGQEKGSEVKAVLAALEFKRAINEMNAERARSGRAPIAIGVGLNTGMSVAGFIGSSQRLEYTCIGDTVNTASRICNMASPNQVLISEDTFSLVSQYFHTEFVACKQFKGKTNEVAVYEVCGVKEPVENLPVDVSQLQL